ncbi:putative basic amino acid antiporter YfcC [Bacillus sporothermodurans]|uniref:YfcC family protein n=1 Tax=Heyndrickxia sporothermodurans TaxID=46224 RepID=UPI00192AFC44|nr:YfcC family protein [Heyndrickxia sporothermodurans]MBL5778301.1 putative basic amino acid antiporter YfcC [Heyndrickxia sporothermodurans]
MPNTLLQFKQKNQSPPQDQEKNVRNINAFVLIFFVIIIAAVLTYIVPAGEYDRVDKDGRTIVVPDSFHLTDSSPVGFFKIFTSIHTGMIQGAGIIFFVLMVGGSFGILKATGALDALILTISKKLANRELLLIPVLMLFFAAGGTLMGMAEETIIYIAIITPLAIALGFDAMVGFAIVSLGANIGFMSAIMNPFNVGVAQSIAELPTFSGIGLRLALLATFYIAGVLFVYRYAKKVKAQPELRFLGNFQKGNTIASDVKLETRHKWVLTVFLLNFVVLITGVLKFGWYITEIAGLFLLFGILIGIIGKLNPNKMADSFMDGAKEVIGGALIIGFAQAILVVFQDGKLMDSVLYYASSLLSQLSPALNAVGMFFVQLFLNFLVPSGSGQAALTMPIMAPLSDLVGVTRQTAVLAFQLGDGITNSIFPTAGVLIAGLAIAGIPFTKWFKWVLPFIFIEIGISVVFLLIAQAIHYGPF